jgi:hypothetical protein
VWISLQYFHVLFKSRDLRSGTRQSWRPFTQQQLSWSYKHICLRHLPCETMHDILNRSYATLTLMISFTISCPYFTYKGAVVSVSIVWIKATPSMYSLEEFCKSFKMHPQYCCAVLVDFATLLAYNTRPDRIGILPQWIRPTNLSSRLTISYITSARRAHVQALIVTQTVVFTRKPKPKYRCYRSHRAKSDHDWNGIYIARMLVNCIQTIQKNKSNKGPNAAT